MLDQVTLHIEGFKALGAVVCFRVVMGLHVSSEVGSVCKLLSTLRTSEGFLSRVRSHVSLQQPGSGESFVADITFMREVVG